jgi:hypothetical protein
MICLDFHQPKKPNDIQCHFFHSVMDLGTKIVFPTEKSFIYICRNCIGMRFALLEAKIAIVKALRVIEIQCCEKTQVNCNKFLFQCLQIDL